MYELLESVELKELNGKGYFYRHQKSQADVIVIKNDDQNKVFSVCFPTPVTNSKGIPHILEHSVLCGSRKYPLKDPFVELMKGSMNTFLNAMTFDDMTLFPIASCNDKDFKNLMDVYLDAVFYPNVLKQKEIFMQEGWHYEIKEEQLSYNGVVYNEMKGYMASPEFLLNKMVNESLYPNSNYRFLSGGDPQKIVELDYQELLDFYYQHYHPSKCLLFLYGDIDVAERLQNLDENYLSHWEADVHVSPSFDDTHTPLPLLTGYYDCQEDHAYFAYNTIISDHHDLLTCMTMELLDYVLTASPGAMLRQALLKENIGQDVYSTMAMNIHHPAYSIVCMNAKTNDQERFFEIVNQTLDKMINEEIDEKMIMAALHSLQFRYREQEFGSTPKGLYYNQQVLMHWLFKEDGVFEMLEVQGALRILEERIQRHEFQDMVKELLCRPHSQVCLYPKSQLQHEQDELERQKLDTIYQAFNDSEKQYITKEMQELKTYQESPEPKEIQNCIPLLTRDDLPKQVQKTFNEKRYIDGIPFYYHELPTKGIGYLKLNFDLRTLPLNLLPYASLLNSLLGMVDTAQQSYLEFYDDMSLHTGGIYHRTYIYDGTLGNGEIRPSYEICAKMLYEEIEYVEKFIYEEIFVSSFKDKQHLFEILTQEKASLQSQFIDSAHVIALNESKKHQSLVEYYLNQMDYLGYYQTICQLLDDFNHVDFVEKIEQTMQYIFNQNYLMISYTGERQSLSKVEESLKRLCRHFTKEIQIQRKPELSYQPVHQAYTIPSQVQFVAVSGQIKEMPVQKLSAYQLLLHILKCDYLWYHVRVRGGAYGCFSIGENHQLFSVVSYRDPHLRETIEIYRQIPKYVAEFQANNRELLQYIIGAISERERPLSNQQIGNLSFSRVLCGVNETFLNQLRKEMIDLQVTDILQLASYLQEAIQNASYCVIGNEKTIEQQKDLFENIKPLLL